MINASGTAERGPALRLGGMFSRPCKVLARAGKAWAPKAWALAKTLILCRGGAAPCFPGPTLFCTGPVLEGPGKHATRPARIYGALAALLICRREVRVRF